MTLEQTVAATYSDAPRRARYDGMTIALHWVTALLVVLLFGTAVAWGKLLPREWHLHRPLESVHISFGILLAAVVVTRLVWRIVKGRRLPQAGSRSVHLLSKAVHWLLYALLAAVIGLGFAMRLIEGQDLSFFGLFSIPSMFGSDRALGHTLENLHNIVAWTIIYVAGGHAIAALFHHHVLRDGVLRRMIPARA